MDRICLFVHSMGAQSDKHLGSLEARMLDASVAGLSVWQSGCSGALLSWPALVFLAFCAILAFPWDRTGRTGLWSP